MRRFSGYSALSASIQTGSGRRTCLSTRRPACVSQVLEHARPQGENRAGPRLSTSKLRLLAIRPGHSGAPVSAQSHLIAPFDHTSHHNEFASQKQFMASLSLSPALFEPKLEIPFGSFKFWKKKNSFFASRFFFKLFILLCSIPLTGHLPEQGLKWRPQVRRTMNCIVFTWKVRTIFELSRL